MQCPRCGAALPQGGTCPACGWVGEMVEQQVTGRADGPAPVEFQDPCETPADTPPEVPIPYPDMDQAKHHHGGSTRTDGGPVSTPGAEATPSEGDEPGTGGGPSRGGFPGGLPLVTGIIVVLVVVIALVLLMGGDKDGDGNGGGDLVIDADATTAAAVWEPTPGFHLAVMVRNEAKEATGMDGHDLLVTVLDGGEEVGRTTVQLSGDLAAGAGRGVLVDVGAAIASGRTYQIDVELRKDGAKVDGYHTEVTVPVT